MNHKVEPYVDQCNPGIDYNDPEASMTAVEIRFPRTFSRKARRVLNYFEGTMFLYSYKGQFVVTDESLMLTPSGDGTSEAPIGAPRWTGNSLDDLERWLELIADENDASDDEIPGWEYPRSKYQILSVGEYEWKHPENVLVKLTHESSYVAITTYDRQHGRLGPFLVEREALGKMLKPSSRFFCEESGGHYLTIKRWDDTVHFQFRWPGSHRRNSTPAYNQEVVIPVSKIKSLFEDALEVSCLSSPLRRHAVIDSRPAATEIREITADKRLRRAFIKVMRDCLSRTEESITLYPLGHCSFLITEKDGNGKSGALFLTKGEVDGRTLISYSLHI